MFVDCYERREVLYNILSQDLKVKYKRTYFGYIWSLLNPLLQLAVLSVIFSHIVRLGMKDYILYLFSGLLAWMFFQNSCVASSMAFLENENFIKKVYLPKLIFPLSKICLKSIDFLFSLVALGMIGLLLGFEFGQAAFSLPMAILSLFLFTLGLSLVVAIATVYFRDIQYLLGVFLQLLYFATPVLYPMHILPEKYQLLLHLNPVFIQIRLFQKLLYFNEMPTLMQWGSAWMVALISITAGLGLLFALEEDLVFRM